MSKETENRVWELLKEITFPGMSRDIVSFGFVDGVRLEGERLEVRLAISTHHREMADRVRDEVETMLREAEVADEVVVSLQSTTPQSAAQNAVARDPDLIPEVKHVVAVASGKGGVGKSTVAANLSVALAQAGYRVGLLDADIYGPSMPMMFGIQQQPVVERERLVPFEKFGVKLMSLGFVLDDDTPVIWRGPMVSSFWPMSSGGPSTFWSWISPRAQATLS
jgi:ATP-binding protein involved in chromosome partitioning